MEDDHDCRGEGSEDLNVVELGGCLHQDWNRGSTSP
jgi:hypothetical protein